MSALPQGRRSLPLSLVEKLEAYLDNPKSAAIYGVSWDKGEDPTLTRTNDAVGMTAAVGVDAEPAINDFDTAEIYREIKEVEDSLGNTFVRIPKFWIRKMDGTGIKTWQISKQHFSGAYLPWCFWDFTNGVELDYVYVGKHLGYISGGVLKSVSGVYPTVNTNIVDFRTAAEANNTVDLLGYQQMDIHVYDMLQVLFYVEFATLNSQSIMAGYTTGRYDVADTLTADTSPAGNTLIVANATGAEYRVGQVISVGTSLGGNQRFYGRTITAIDVDTPAAGSTTITFDGAAVELFTGDILYNTAMKTGFSSAIAASSGSIDSNSSGKFSFKYRGIESLYGDVWQFVDGLNIEADNQAWICRDANDYASNLFASPYEVLSYVNHNNNGYPVTMGFDPANPFAELPTAVAGGADNKYYCDYYNQAAGNLIARIGGRWNGGLLAGLSGWHLGNISSIAHASIGARLVKKAL